MHGEISPEMAALSWAGIAIVFGVLAVIATAVALLKKLDDRWQRAEAQTDIQAVSKTQDIDDTTLVLIAAAASVAVAGRFKIRKIRRLLPLKTKRTPWSAQGRLILHGSHLPQRNRKPR